MSNAARRGGMRGGPMAMGMTMPGVKAKDFRKSFQRLLTLLQPQYARLITVISFAILSTTFSIVGPKILGKITTSLIDSIVAKFMARRLNQIPPAVDFPYIGRIVAFLIGLYLISAFFGYLQRYIMAGVAQTVVRKMRKDVHEKLDSLPLRYFDSNPHGDVMSRVSNDIDNISTTLQQTMTQLITSVATIIGAIIMMLSISLPLTVVTIVTLPAAFTAIRRIVTKSQKNFAAQQKELGILNGHVEEMFTGHVIVKAFRREGASIEKFNEVNDRLYSASWRAQFVSGVIMPIMNFINNIGYVIICVVGGLLVTRNLIKLGDIQAFIQYSRQFTYPIAQTANIANVLQSTIASAERVFEILDEEEEIPEIDKPIVLGKPKGDVAFTDVRFGYSNDVPLMDHLNIRVGSGQVVAIVGPTGAGKTTLVNLLMRFYEIQGGVISIDGVDIRDMRRGELRTIFGMVLQDTWLFNGTIRENIGYGRPVANEQDIVDAATMAHADHFIRALPQGYDTILNEEASNISQGEKQLLTIARAILADPAILILDEATSSVDTRTEVFIQNAMKTLMAGRTSFVIAHRLSTIRDAERILVMRDGGIIEQGKHDELLAQGGFYSDLYQSQFSKSFVE